MGTLIILVGIPGSGKSTFATKMKTENKNVVVVSSDMVRKEVFGDEAIQYTEKVAMERFKKKHIDITGKSEEEIKSMMKFVCNNLIFGIVYNRMTENLQKGKTVIFDATNVSIKDRKNIFNRMKGTYDSSICYYFPITIEDAIERDAKRVRTVGRDVIERLHGNLVVPTTEEGFDIVFTVV